METGRIPNDFVIVAELDRKIIGLLLLIFYYRFDEACPSAWIENLFVLKAFRGYRVATRLVDLAKELAKRRGCKALSLIVGLRNLAGLRFYRQCGFKINKAVGLASQELGNRVPFCPGEGQSATLGRR
ncbi:MAG: GNAT family N-acetyltransferase [Candidatus Acetothermia bacterium]|jgi:GNAT superfamily N-acetyltransferase|nr:GNAT family N-acetyltransferase [Candidatus Acetothermia bacterium]MDH7505954.1 GNAT family N-acetyltransferase [Candidatus Acetothermia bacterium]